MSIEDDLVDLEHGFWNAAGNGDFYREHMAEDGLCLLAVGVMGQAATAEAIDQAQPWTDHEFHDLVAFVHGESTATICYRAEARRDETHYRAAVSTTYRRADDGWRLLVHQQTPLGPA